MDNDFVGFRADLENLEVLDRDHVASHASWHALAFSHATGTDAASAVNRTDFTLGMLLTVGSGTSAEVMALDGTLKALAFRERSDGNGVADGKMGKFDLVAELKAGELLRRYAELGEVAEIAEVLEVTADRLREALLFLGTEADLEGGVSVFLDRLDLRDRDRTRRKDRRRIGAAGFVEDLSHGLFRTKDKFLHSVRERGLEFRRLSVTNNVTKLTGKHLFLSWGTYYSTDGDIANLV